MLVKVVNHRWASTYVTVIVHEGAECTSSFSPASSFNHPEWMGRPHIIPVVAPNSLSVVDLGDVPEGHKVLMEARAAPDFRAPVLSTLEVTTPAEGEEEQAAPAMHVHGSALSRLMHTTAVLLGLATGLALTVTKNTLSRMHSSCRRVVRRKKGEEEEGATAPEVEEVAATMEDVSFEVQEGGTGEAKQEEEVV